MHSIKTKLIHRYLILFAALVALGAAPAAASTGPNYCDPLSGCPTHHHKTHHKVKRCTTKRVRRHHHTVRVKVCKTVWVYS
jgi:hypothetical protein